MSTRCGVSSAPGSADMLNKSVQSSFKEADPESVGL